MKNTDYMIIAAAVISLLFSIFLWFGGFGEGQKLAAVFVGIWVPSILSVANFIQSRRVEA